MTATLTHWINGAAQAGASGRYGDVYNPAAGEVVARVPFASSNEVESAVQAAAEAAPGWGATPPIQRARVIFAFKELVESRKEDLARVITREHGKVLSDALGSVSRGMEVLEFACGIPHLLRGDFTQSVGTGVDSFSSRQPPRRGRRHHALQLPGHGADVDVPGRHRLRQHVHPQAVGEGPHGRDDARRMAQGGRLPRRRVQRRPRRQGGGGRDPRPPGHRRGELRGLHAHRRVRLSHRLRSR